MKRYGFGTPSAWVRRPYPPPQKGVYVTAPAGTPRASILLMEPLAIVGALGEQVVVVAGEGCAGTEVVERLGPGAVAPAGELPGVFAAARVRVTFGGRVRDEARWFGLFEGLGERLPVVFLGDVDALPHHRAALDLVVGSLCVLHSAGESLY